MIRNTNTDNEYIDQLAVRIAQLERKIRELETLVYSQVSNAGINSQLR